MKTIGLVGGTSWVSTKEYYQVINQETNKRLGSANSAKCLIYSLNFEEVLSLQKMKDSNGVYNLILNAGKNLVNAGAEGIALCANTMHRYADQLQKELGIPLIHIADATAKEINNKGLNKVALLGTRITMDLDFYSNKLQSYGISVLTPDEKDKDYVNDKIFNELVYDRFLPETKSGFLDVMNRLKDRGAEGFILGCTEIPLLIDQNDTDLTLFDTLKIHAKAIVDFSLA